MTVIGIDQGFRQALQADHVIDRARRHLEGLGWGDDLWVVTHSVAGDQGNHVAYALVTGHAAAADELVRSVHEAFTLDEGDDEHHHEPHATAVWCQGVSFGDPALVAGAQKAVEIESGAQRGRAVVYPGVDALRGTIAVADITRLSAIEAVSSMGGPLSDDAQLVTREHVRPLRQQGRWVLHVQPAAGGVQVPFEAPVHHACCEDH